MDVKKPVKARFSVTLTLPYIKLMDKILQSGLYLNTGDVLREALKLLFEKHGFDLFTEIGDSDEN